jgi:hypothetical protein
MLEVMGVILLSPLSHTADVSAGTEMDIATVKANQFGRPQAGLGGKPKQGMVAPPGPGRPCGGGQQCVEFLLRQERHKPSLKTLRRNGEHPFDRRGMLGVTKGGESEQGSDSGKPRIPGSPAVAPMTLEVIEEVADTRGIEVVKLQPGRFCAMPRSGED